MNCLNPAWKYLSMYYDDEDDLVIQTLHKDKPILKNWYNKFFKDDIVRVPPFFVSEYENLFDSVFNDNLLKGKQYILYSIEPSGLKEVLDYERHII